MVENLRKAFLIMIFVGSVVVSGILGFFIGVNHESLPSLPQLLSPLPGDEFYLKMGSSSMQPAINAGDTIRVKKITNASIIETSDIIVFKKPSNTEETIVHRVVNKKVVDGLWYFQTKGDNNPAPDYWVGEDTLNGWISEKLLVGKVI